MIVSQMRQSSLMMSRRWESRGGLADQNQWCLKRVA